VHPTGLGLWFLEPQAFGGALGDEEVYTNVCDSDRFISILNSICGRLKGVQYCILKTFFSEIDMHLDK
jgi:hypothetical protein